MNGTIAKLIIVVAALYSIATLAQNEMPPQTLFTNVHVWDGTSEGITQRIDVLVENNLIKKIRAEASDAHADATVIDAPGMILMPGLHDMHTHISISRPPAGDLRINMTPFLVGAVATARIKTMLMNGFTTIRDIGGPAKFMQRAIDAGIVPGPRILPTEGFITQTSGHGDMRNRADPNPNIDARGSNNFMEGIDKLNAQPNQI